MNALFSVLTEDHDKVKSILEEIEKLDESEGENREKLLAQLKKELIPHARAEEQVLYARMQSQDREAKVLGLEGFEEHHVVDLLLEELESEDPESPLWDAKFSVLSENLKHHIREEEAKIFDAFDKGKHDYDKLCDKFLELKKEMKKDLPTQRDVGTTPEQAAQLQ